MLIIVIDLKGNSNEESPPPLEILREKLSEESAKIGTTLKDLKVFENVHGYDGHAKFTPSNRKVHTMPRLEIVKVSPHQLPGKNIAIPVTKAMWDSNAKGLNLSKVIHYYIGFPGK